MSKSKELGKAFPEYFSDAKFPDGWTTKKPKFDKECLLITAVKIRGVLEYSIWQIRRVESEFGWYLGWLNGEGEEYGDRNDLKADRYLVLPLLKNTK